MNELDMQFHTAVFGGFQKQDVMSYLESSTQATNQKLANLQHELNELKENYSLAEQARNKAESRLSALESEKAELVSTTSNQQMLLTQLQAELQALTAERDSLIQERNTLAEQVKVMKPQAEGYEVIKDRTAGIELEAHGRAQVIENEAREKARLIRDEMDGWCAHLQETYDGIHKDAEAAITRASQELEKANQYLGTLSEAYADHEKLLHQLQQDVEQITGPKVPMPIPEEEA